MSEFDRLLTYVRIALLALVVLLALPIVGDYVTAPASVTPGTAERTDGSTVVTIDALGPGQIVTVGPNGGVLSRNRTFNIYHDVDPSPAGKRTVTYVASRGQLDASKCPTESKCMLNVVEQVNLTTGNVTRLYSRMSINTGSTQIHDVDRVNESVLLVANIIHPDSIYMVNTTTGERIWEWNVSAAYSPSTGGRHPSDWTHVNDVEYLPDGRVMANLRNQDQVVFVEPGRGLLENWTLGSDDNHSRLYEPHNPDYIPRERGGPAVLIGDSENNRIVEYQRSNGSWALSWRWQDARLSWPRDADRLPNGNTLIVDSHGQRLFEVNRTGAIVWSRPFPNGGYDAERLGTGAESAGGRSIRALRRSDATGVVRRGRVCAGPTNCLEHHLTGLFPSLVLHGFLFVLPDWVTPLGGAALLLQFLVVGSWGVVEVVVHRRQILDRLNTP